MQILLKGTFFQGKLQDDDKLFGDKNNPGL